MDMISVGHHTFLATTTKFVNPDAKNYFMLFNDAGIKLDELSWQGSDKGWFVESAVKDEVLFAAGDELVVVRY